MKPRLVFSAPHAFLPVQLFDELRSRFDVEIVYGVPLEQQLARLETARVWVVSTAPERFLGPDVFDRCPSLDVVATPSTGVTHLDAEYLRQRGVRLLTIRDSPVIEQIRASSEFTLALLLALVRRLPTALREASEGRWRENEAVLRGNELARQNARCCWLRPNWAQHVRVWARARHADACKRPVPQRLRGPYATSRARRPAYGIGRRLHVRAPEPRDARLLRSRIDSRQ